MVLEALTAVGLAAAVVQFVDFTAKLISKGNKYYRSEDGALEEHKELRRAADNVNRLSERLTHSAEPYTQANNLQPEEQALKHVAQDCLDIAKELTAKLDDLKLEGGRQRWKSFRQALKSCWSKEKIEKMLQRLELARGNLILNLLVTGT